MNKLRKKILSFLIISIYLLSYVYITPTYAIETQNVEKSIESNEIIENKVEANDLKKTNNENLNKENQNNNIDKKQIEDVENESVSSNSIESNHEKDEIIDIKENLNEEKKKDDIKESNDILVDNLNYQKDTSFQDTSFYATQESNFSVIIPKVIILSGETKNATYSINVSGNIRKNESVKVIPDQNFIMEQYGKNNIEGTISQDKNEWFFGEFEEKGFGEIVANDMTAGPWKGIFNFTISLNKTTTIVDETSDPGLYDKDGMLLYSWDELITNKYILCFGLDNMITDGELYSELQQTLGSDFEGYFVIKRGIEYIQLQFFGSTMLDCFFPDTIKVVYRYGPSKNIYLNQNVESVMGDSFKDVENIYYEGNLDTTGWGMKNVNDKPIMR